MLYIILFVLGAAWGSFLNAATIRIQNGKTFVTGRSACMRCGTGINWHDLIPIAGYLLLGGKCRSCRGRISARYIAVEFFVAGLFVLGAFAAHTPLEALLYLAVVSFFTVLFLYDASTYLVPDKIVVPAIIIIGLLNMQATGSVLSLLLGSLFGGAWFLAQFLVSRGRWVGGGDIRLGVLMGVLLGHQMVWLSLGIAYIGGSIIAIALVLARRARLNGKVPFATFLLPAAFVAWMWGAEIFAWYRNIVGF